MSDTPVDQALADPEEILLALTKCPEYVELQNLRDDIDVFALFDSVLEENCWKHVMAFLLNSRKGHGLGASFLTGWLEQAREIGPAPLRILLDRLNIDDESEFRSMNDWQTSGRKLDLLVEILDSNGQVKSVLAFEDKSGSGGGHDPFLDFQQALDLAYPNIPKLLVYLVNYKVWRPDPEPRYCPCISCHISSVTKTCEKLEATTDGSVKLLLASIRIHVERRLLERKKMEEQAREIIQRLHQRREHRQAIRLLSQYAPTIRSVVEEMHDVVRYAINDLPKPIAPAGPVVWSFFPKGAVSPKEIKIEFGELTHRTDPHGITIVYVMDSDMSEPDIGDTYTLRVMAWWGNENALQKLQMLNLRAYLPAPMSKPEGWACWEPLWVGNSYRMEDIGPKDVQGLSAVLVDGIARTYSRIRDRVIEKLK